MLGEYYTELPGSPNSVIYRVIEIYTYFTHETAKLKLLNNSKNHHHLRIVIATVAFGMGINCPDVRHIIRWGASRDAKMYV